MEVTRKKIIDSIKYVVDNSEYVSINYDNIKNSLPLLNGDNKKAWLHDFIDIDKYTDKEKIIFLILCESMNFCFWDSPIKWKIEYKNNYYSGSFGVFYALSKALNNGKLILDEKKLKEISMDDLDDIFKGTTTIPLLKERYNIFKSVVDEISKIDDLCSIFNVNSDIDLLNVVVNHFSNFRDISIYKEHEIYFFKRANLLVTDLILNIDFINKRVDNFDNLVGCADYKIPQVLREMGILCYSDSLKNLIDNKIPIEHDSLEEIEIRANMLYAMEIIKDELKKSGKKMNASSIDNALWLVSKRDDFKSNPHHLTKTIYY